MSLQLLIIWWKQIYLGGIVFENYEMDSLTRKRFILNKKKMIFITRLNYSASTINRNIIINQREVTLKSQCLDYTRERIRVKKSQMFRVLVSLYLFNSVIVGFRRRRRCTCRLKFFFYKLKMYSHNTSIYIRFYTFRACSPPRRPYLFTSKKYYII